MTSPRESQNIGWELTLVIGLFTMDYAFMLNFMSRVVYVTGFFVGSNPPSEYLWLTILLYGVIPPLIAVVFTYLLIDGEIARAYVAKSERASYWLRFPRFILLLIERIVLVSLSPVGCALGTLSILSGVSALIPSPPTAGSQTFFGIASTLSSYWLFAFLVAVGIEFSISVYRWKKKKPKK